MEGRSVCEAAVYKVLSAYIRSGIGITILFIKPDLILNFVNASCFPAVTCLGAS